MSQLQLFLFGPPRIERNGAPIELGLRKADALLIYLAMTRQPHSRDALATLFWPQDDQSAARANLRRALHRLNQALGKEIVAAAAETVGLAQHADIWLDIAAFQHHVDAAPPRARPASALSDEELAQLIAAAEFYRDDFLAGFSLLDCPAFDEWQYFERESLRQSLAGIFERLVEIYQARHQFAEAVPFARRWLALDPLHEPVHCQLMKLYAWSGNGAAALRQYAECERILEAELGVSPAAEMRALFEAIRSKRFLAVKPPPGTARPPTPSAGPSVTTAHPAPAYAPMVTPQHNLLAQPTPFVGREAELAEIVSRLGDPACRLLTLTGPGGVGKTRLALRAAQWMLDEPKAAGSFTDGLFFVSLAALQTPAEIVPAIIAAIDLTIYADRTAKEQLLSHLRDKQMLLVLDNFEHLLDGDALVAEILVTAPGVKLVVTSREGLNLAEEWFHPIAGLTYPHEHEGTVPPLHTYSAVRLFEGCAQRARLGFSLEQEQEHVVRICRLVDGMPLALELAASWLRTVTTGRIADEIAQGIDILTTQHRNVPARHRSMRVVLEQSWALLAPNERRMLMQLSLCRGGFGQEAAAQIAGASLLSLATLVEKSLVRSITGDRYQMHELIRQFAEERLHAAAEDEQTTRQRHAAYYLQFLVERGPTMFRSDAHQATAELNAELDNISMAWRWAVTQHDLAAVERAVGSFGHIYWIRGRVQEADELFAEAIAHFEAQPTLQTEAQWEAVFHSLHHLRASFNYFLGNFTVAQAEFQIGLVQAQRLANQQHIASINNTLGAIAGYQGNLTQANEHLQTALAIYEACNDQNGLADVQQELARVSMYPGDYRGAIRWATASLEASQQIGRRDFIAYALVTIGWACFCQGEYGVAQRCYEKGLSHFEALGHRFGVALGLGGLGIVAWASAGALEKAQDLVERSLQLCRQVGHRLQTAHRLAMLAQIANDRHHFAAAQHFARQGLALARAVGNPNFTAQNLCCLAESAYRTGDLTASRSYLAAALEVAAPGSMLPRVMLALFHYAHLLVQETRQLSLSQQTEQEQITLAVQLLTLVAHSSVAWHIFRERAKEQLARCTAEFPDEAQLAARTPPPDWQTAVEQLIRQSHAYSVGHVINMTVVPSPSR